MILGKIGGCEIWREGDINGDSYGYYWGQLGKAGKVLARHGLGEKGANNRGKAGLWQVRDRANFALSWAG